MLAVEKYKIINKNIYSFDKKKFMIKVTVISTQVIILKKIKSLKIIKASQDKNKEWILLLAAICAIPMKFIFCFIF